MTKEGHEWVEASSGKMISTIKTALDANQTTVTFIQQHFKAIEIGLGGFIVASGLAKLGEMAKGIGEIFNIGRAMINIASGTITGAGAAQAEGATGGGILGFLSRNAGVTSVVGAIAAGIYEARESEKWSRTHAAEIISEERARTAKGGTVGTEWATANFPDSPAMREYAAKHQENAAAVDKATAATNNAVPALESGRFRGVRVKGARVRLGETVRMPESSVLPTAIYQLRVVLCGVSPLVWRRLLVTSDTSISELHEILQSSFDWSGEHLHRFLIHGKPMEFRIWAALDSWKMPDRYRSPVSVCTAASASAMNTIS